MTTTNKPLSATERQGISHKRGRTSHYVLETEAGALVDVSLNPCASKLTPEQASDCAAALGELADHLTKTLIGVMARNDLETVDAGLRIIAESPASRTFEHVQTVLDSLVEALRDMEKGVFQLRNTSNLRQRRALEQDMSHAVVEVRKNVQLASTELAGAVGVVAAMLAHGQPTSTVPPTK